ncbi:Rap1 GTPase-GDP dissociation stimulator 1-B [Apiospora rasikravindrae]|uniref:Rap1 GTPase-GDP dissociation stimulator 1-B n=1 Tax=Apiospora rasikravindrae TaxID=990691 RepID=A0ABR1TD20_9PEZI
MTPGDVAAVFARQDYAEDSGTRISEEGQSGRVEALSPILTEVRGLWEGGSEELDHVVQKIGDGSREVKWRKPLGESGMLDFFLGLVNNDGLRPALIMHTLRIIGNCCADTDENRDRVVASNCMPRLVNLLNNDGLLALIIPVLFNILVDYEPTQAAAYKAGLNPELVSLISGPRLPTAAPQMGLICKLLGLIASQEAEANFVHPATPFTLLTLANEPSSDDEEEDLEDYMSQTSVALAYLSNPSFQESFLQTPKSIHLFLSAFAKGVKRSAENDVTMELEYEDAEQLKKILSIFPQALADLSAAPPFVAAAPIGSPELGVLRDWLADSSRPKLQSAACLALGNVARSDETCTAFVQQSAIHTPLAAIVADASVTDAQLLHGAVSFLKNLAIPAANKPLIGAAGLLEPGALPRVWEMDAAVQVQFAAVSLARLLMVSCPDNVRRMCARHGDGDGAKTLLQQLTAVFKRSDQEPTKTEAARAVAAVLRVLHSSPDVPSILSSSTTDTKSTGELLTNFYATHETIPEALTYLGAQKKFPVLRSELWFVLALMSRSPEGAQFCAKTLQQTELTRALLEAVTGRDILAERQAATGTTPAIEAAAAAPAEEKDEGVQKIESGVQGLGLGGFEPQQIDATKKADLSRMDRENGLVLVTELLQRCADKLPDEDLFLEALRAGGQKITDERRALDGAKE